jgi:hypothetical protein
MIFELKSTGSNIGNLYFATWFGFGLAVLLTFSSFKDMVKPEDAASEESEHPEVTKGGQQQGEGEAQRRGEGEMEEVDVEGRDEP